MSSRRRFNGVMADAAGKTVARFATVANRGRTEPLSRHHAPLATLNGVELHWLCTHRGAEVLRVWRNGHSYQVSISEHGESVSVAAEGN